MLHLGAARFSQLSLTDTRLNSIKQKGNVFTHGTRKPRAGQALRTAGSRGSNMPALGKDGLLLTCMGKETQGSPKAAAKTPRVSDETLGRGGCGYPP